MKKIYPNRLLLLLLSLWTLSAASAQNTVGLLSYDTEKAFEGYNLLFPHNQSTVYLLDNCGQVIHTWPDEDNWRPGNSVYLTEQGNLIKCKRENASIMDPIWAGGGGAIVEILNWENELIASFERNDSLYRLHHDVAPMPNGNILMVVWENQTLEAALAAGRDPAKLDRDELWSEVIWEWDPVADSVVWEWRVWDHLVQDFDATKDNFGTVASNPQLIDINYDEHDGHPDWLHINAIDYNPVLDQIIMSVPYFNEVWVVDHQISTAEAAGPAGDLLYRYGNPQAYRQGTAEDQQLFFQHDSKWTNPNAQPGEPDFGQLSVYNNRVREDYAPMTIWNPLTESGDYAFADGQFEVGVAVREVFHPDSLDIAVSNALSSAAMLPNGNALLLAGRWGFAYEVSPENEVVWEYRIPIRAGSAVEQGEELSRNNNITFRVDRYGMDHPAFVGKELLPLRFWELNPNTDACPLMVVNTDSELLPEERFHFFPNPASDRIQLSLPEAGPLQLLNAQGKVIRNWSLAAGQHDLSLGFLPKGLYFLKTKAQVEQLLIH
ncbi:MAG TPA: aryl-sulfate sulfotransferase [Saprospiraceae bacterium]|nr:aryl-sulfate sulfotransferase [Saprospiraceae bacterium]